MKVFVHGNCQAVSFAAALRGQMDAEAIFVAGVDGYDRVRDCEVVFLQSEFWHHGSQQGGGHLDTDGKLVVRMPTFFFAGLFPDAILERPGGRTLLSPAGVYNSSIALHGFLSGLTVAETVALFRPETYRRLSFDRYWTTGRDAMVADLGSCGLAGAQLFEEFLGFGKFAFSSHHPILPVCRSVMRDLVRLHGLPPARDDAPQADPLAIHGDWPVYPGVAEGPGMPHGLDFCFDDPLPGQRLKAAIPLAEFVRRSFKGYAAWPAGTIRSERLDGAREAYAGLRPAAARHAYSGLPPSSFWRHAVASAPHAAVDAVVTPKWQVDRRDRIATAGSCFAQHIGGTLRRRGLKVLDSEPAPATITAAEASRRHYGLFSARYGNVYTTRQLLQLIRRAIGAFTPAEDVWQRPDGRFVDPFRPQIEPDGFATAGQVIADTDRHLRAVLAALETMDVFVFTLGLTEAWASATDGAVFPLAPGVVAGTMDPDRYRFHNFTATQVRSDLRRALDLLRDINPRLKVLLTVSPVPLAATFEPRHVLTATTYSKSVLRVVAEEMVADHGFVDYFPSYEMIAGSQAAQLFFEADRRSVTAAGVEHVMASFCRHYLADGEAVTPPPLARLEQAGDPRRQLALDGVPPPGGIMAEIAAGVRHLCDEDALAPRAILAR